MNTPVDLLRSFAASVSLTLGLARLAEKLDPSGLAVGADEGAHTATRTVLLSYPSSVPERAALRTTLVSATCNVPENTALRTCQMCSPCEAPTRTVLASVVPCHVPVAAA